MVEGLVIAGGVITVVLGVLGFVVTRKKTENTARLADRKKDRKNRLRRVSDR